MGDWEWLHDWRPVFALCVPLFELLGGLLCAFLGVDRVMVDVLLGGAVGTVAGLLVGISLSYVYFVWREQRANDN